MYGLSFEVAPAHAEVDPNRTDVACFVGYVVRRDTRLPQATRTAFERAGWVAGPWQRPDDEVEAALHLPVVVENWSTFDAIFAWDQRPVSTDEAETDRPLRCASYLGAAVRSFFAQGGRRAVIIRVGDPWPYLETAEQRVAAHDQRIANLLQTDASAVDRTSWRGMAQLFGLPEVTFVCLPDLPDLCASEPEELDVAVEPPSSPEVFVRCTQGPVAAVIEDVGLRTLAPPRCTTEGLGRWHEDLARARERIARFHREMLLVAALPLPTVQAHHAESDRAWAQSDYLAYLERSGVLTEQAASDSATTASSAFIQLGWPWLSTGHSDDLPSRLEPADGLLVGMLANNALRRGTFRSMAGTRLTTVFGSEPQLSWSGVAETPAERLAERVCVVAPSTDGWYLRSDVTTTHDPAWRAGGVSRLLGAVLRAARRTAESAVFEASGPELWSQVRRSLEQTLIAFWHEGGLGGASQQEAFDVRCDRSTMSQSDLDNGRLRAEITVLPVAAVEQITVVLDLAGAQTAGTAAEVA